MAFRMYVPTRILFGQGALGGLHEQSLPGTKALLVTSSGTSVRKNGSLERVSEELRSAGVEFAIYDKIQGNPVKSSVMAGASFARENRCDFVVALGGGSVMDASKAIAMMATNDGDLWDYVWGGTGKGMPLPNEPLPVVCITTTAGTGSEVDQWGVVTNEETQEKIGVGGLDALFPKIAVVDPELMRTVPATYTAYQGFDALLQAVECYISKGASLMSDMYALTAIREIGAYLPRAVADGDDIEAREHVAFGNTLSGVVMTVSVCTSEHSMEHAMSAFHPELPHGAGLIMISKEYFTHFIQKHVCDGRFVEMAKALGNADASDPMDFIDALTRLQDECGVGDLKMTDFGIAADEADALAVNARTTMGGLFDFDPAPMTHDECVAIYAKSHR